MELGIELDGHKTHYRPGETVSGRVTVRTRENVVCNGSRVALQWFTHGKGNRRDGDIDAEKLFVGMWTPGAVAYPFRFVAPATPLAYDGEVLNVGFRIFATADLPWKIDPEAQALIDVRHEVAPSGLAIRWDAEKYAASHGDGCMGVSVALLVLGVGAGIIGFAAMAGPLLGIAFTAVLGGLIGAGSSWARFAADRELGRVGVKLEQRRAGGYRSANLGDVLHVTLTLSRPQAKLDGAGAVLDVREDVVSGAGSSSQTHTHPLFQSTCALQATAPGRLEGDIELPVDAAPYSFYATDNKLTWELALHIDIPGSADWEEKIELFAEPAPRA